MTFAFSVNWRTIALPLQVGWDATGVTVRFLVFTARFEKVNEYNDAMTICGWWEADGSERYSYS